MYTVKSTYIKLRQELYIARNKVDGSVLQEPKERARGTSRGSNKEARIK